jgi:uncharacterized membrane protein
MATKAGYVITEAGLVLVQVSDETSRWGFALVDDEQTWDGGFIIAKFWDLVEDDDPRITDEDRDRLGWILDQARDQAREFDE